jgi:hypothetical protein
LFILCSANVTALKIVFSNNSPASTAKWETCQIFRGQIVGACLAGASVTKTATLLGVLREAVSKVMMAQIVRRHHQLRVIVAKNHN